MSHRKLTRNESDSSDEREYSSAVFLCPHCGKVFVTSPFKVQIGEGKCPRCKGVTNNFVKKE